MQVFDVAKTSQRMYLFVSFRKSTLQQNRHVDILTSNIKQCRRYCGGVDFLKLINECILCDKDVAVLATFNAAI